MRGIVVNGKTKSVQVSQAARARGSSPYAGRVQLKRIGIEAPQSKTLTSMMKKVECASETSFTSQWELVTLPTAGGEKRTEQRGLPRAYNESKITGPTHPN